jgi:hypothetical protein
MRATTSAAGGKDFARWYAPNAPRKPSWDTKAAAAVQREPRDAISARAAPTRPSFV